MATLAERPAIGFRKPKLRVTKRSRKGCRNCKLRSVKCDEIRPSCDRCQSYGVRCNYIDNGPDLQLAATGAQCLLTSWCSSPSVDQGLLPRRDGLLSLKFQRDVAMTMSFGRRLALFQNEIVALSQSYSFLRHAILSVTMMYDNQFTIASDSIPIQPNEDVLHWYLAVSKYQKSIAAAATSNPSTSLDINHQAALSATSALLVIPSFNHLRSTDPEHAWPMVTESDTSSAPSDDLAWMKLSNGKIAAQSLTPDLQTDPIFHDLIYVDHNEPDPDALTLDPTLSPPSSLLLLETSHSIFSLPSPTSPIFPPSNLIRTILQFWSFVSSIPNTDFETRLRTRDPYALVVLLYWYAKLHPLPVWWLKKRTLVEGRAIVLFLRRWHGGDEVAMGLLGWPVSVLWP